MSFVGSNILAGASGQGGGGYEIERSLRFNSSDSSSLSRTVSSSGNLKTYTLSMWVKRSKTGYIYSMLYSTNGAYGIYYQFKDTDKLEIADYYGGSYQFQLVTTRVFRDTSAWYHIVAAVDTTQATASNRVKLYVNGVQETQFDTSNYPSLNYEGSVSRATIVEYLGDMPAGDGFNGYLADVNFIDGQALAPTDFGETDDNGVWQPKEFDGTYSHSEANGATSPSVFYSEAPSYQTIGNINSGSGPVGVSNSNGGYIRVKFHSAQTSVTTIGFVGGAYTAGGSFEVFVNGSSVATKTVITGWGADSITISSTDITEIEFRTTASGYALGQLAFNSTLVPGTPSLGTPASGTNSFYLPFTDNSSNAALGTDTSGNSNTWTVNNLEASPGAAIPVSTATGALPIYNTTDSQGAVKGTGTRTDSNSSYLSLAVAMDGTNGATTFTDESATIKGSGSAKAITVTSASTYTATSQYYGSSGDFTASTPALLTVGSSSDFAFGTGDFTVEYWLNMSVIGGTPYSSGAVNTAGSFSIFSDSSYFYVRARPGVDTAFTWASVGVSTGEWHHYAVVRNSGTISIYIDGSVVASQSNSNTITSQALQTGALAGYGYHTNGYMQDFRVYKGLAKYTSNFTVVAPANLALQAGTDSLVDTPTNGTQPDTGAGGEVVGNYATLNPLDKEDTSLTLTNGNLQVNKASGNTWKMIRSSMRMDSGAWYWEVQALDSGSNSILGVCTFDTNTSFIGGTYQDRVLYPATGDIWGIAYDADNGTLDYYKNGTLRAANSKTGVPQVGLFAAASLYGPYVTSNPGFIFNFGQRAFAYPLSGYKSLNTANLPEPTIADGSQYFDTKLYTGNGGTQAVTGLNFSPSFVWYKSRSSSSYNHGLFDILRGPSKQLFSNDTSAEGTYSGVTSFNSDGFTLGSDAGGNLSSGSYAAWAWDAGDSNTTIAAGSLNSSAYDQSQTWSGLWTGTAGYGSFANLHNADITDYVQSLNGTLTFGSAIAVTSIRIYANRYGANATLSINGTDVTSQLAAVGSGLQWNTITGFTSVTSIAVTGADYSSNLIGLYGIELSGKLLVDSGVSVTNVPSIASTVRANPSAGFSIVSFTNGDGTVGHGLSAPPELIITKRRDAAYTWGVYSKPTTKDAYLALDSTAASGAVAGMWGSAEPTSSVFGTTFYVAPVGSDMIAYCFAPVEGYSAMDSYVGNGSADGPFVFTGFRPAFILVKSSTDSKAWVIWDTSRSTFNQADDILRPNASSAELSNYSSGEVDILSNGFKLRGNWGATNSSGQTYIYLAFASNPFKTARAH